MMRMTWSSFWKTTFVSSSLPDSLDVDLARAVDHDLGDALVAQERLERAEADDLVGDLLEHPDPLGAGQGEAFLVDDLAEDLLDLAADLDLVGQVELGVEVLDDAALDPELDVPERLADRALGHEPRWAGAARWRAAAGPPGRGRSRQVRRRARRTGRRVERSRSASGGTSPTPLPAREGPTSTSAMRTTTSSGTALLASSGRRRLRSPPAMAVASRRMSWDTWASRLLTDERDAAVQGVDDAPTVADDRVVDLAADRVLDVRDADAERRIGPVEDRAGPCRAS